MNNWASTNSNPYSNNNTFPLDEVTLTQYQQNHMQPPQQQQQQQQQQMSNSLGANNTVPLFDYPANSSAQNHSNGNLGHANPSNGNNNNNNSSNNNTAWLYEGGDDLSLGVLGGSQNSHQHHNAFGAYPPMQNYGPTNPTYSYPPPPSSFPPHPHHQQHPHHHHHPYHHHPLPPHPLSHHHHHQHPHHHQHGLGYDPVPRPQPQNLARDPSTFVLCRHFTLTGTCKVGDRCKFAHGETELRHWNSNKTPSYVPVITSSAPLRLPPDTSGLLQRPHTFVLCRHYVRGQCRVGHVCRFAHGVEELNFWNRLSGLAEITTDQVTEQVKRNLKHHSNTATQPQPPSGMLLGPQSAFANPHGYPNSQNPLSSVLNTTTIISNNVGLFNGGGGANGPFSQQQQQQQQQQADLMGFGQGSGRDALQVAQRNAALNDMQHWNHSMMSQQQQQQQNALNSSRPLSPFSSFPTSASQSSAQAALQNSRAYNASNNQQQSYNSVLASLSSFSFSDDPAQSQQQQQHFQHFMQQNGHTPASVLWDSSLDFIIPANGSGDSRPIPDGSPTHEFGDGAEFGGNANLHHGLGANGGYLMLNDLSHDDDHTNSSDKNDNDTENSAENNGAQGEADSTNADNAVDATKNFEATSKTSPGNSEGSASSTVLKQGDSAKSADQSPPTSAPNQTSTTQNGASSSPKAVSEDPTPQTTKGEDAPTTEKTAAPATSTTTTTTTTNAWNSGAKLWFSPQQQSTEPSTTAAMGNLASTFLFPNNNNNNNNGSANDNSNGDPEITLPSTSAGMSQQQSYGLFVHSTASFRPASPFS